MENKKTFSQLIQEGKDRVKKLEEELNEQSKKLEDWKDEIDHDEISKNRA